MDWFQEKTQRLGTSPTESPVFVNLCIARDPTEGGAFSVDCGSPEAQELVTAIGRILEEKVAWRYRLELCQRRNCSPCRLWQGTSFHLRGSLWPTARGMGKCLVLQPRSRLCWPELSYSVTRIRARTSHPQKRRVAFEDPPLCHSENTSPLSGVAVPHPNPPAYITYSRSLRPPTPLIQALCSEIWLFYWNRKHFPKTSLEKKFPYEIIVSLLRKLQSFQNNSSCDENSFSVSILAQPSI